MTGRPPSPAVAPAPSRHRPVVLAEVLAGLDLKPGGTYLDATFGGGGYSRAILERGVGHLFAIDRDPRAVSRGHELAEATAGFVMLEGPFGEMETLLGQAGIEDLDGIVFDLGVSSDQIDDPERGFSFQADGPLDMRMGSHGISAADVVNGADETTLAAIIHGLSEERAARRIARAIVERRQQSPFRRTTDLADVVRRVVGGHGLRIDPATRTFQALRIHVNDELGELERGLAAAERLLVPGGRLVVVAFHSLEDRIVKRFLEERTNTGAGGSRHRPEVRRPASSFRLVRRGALKASEDEIQANPRARSARLRVAERLDAAALADAEGQV